MWQEELVRARQAQGRTKTWLEAAASALGQLAPRRFPEPVQWSAIRTLRRRHSWEGMVLRCHCTPLRALRKIA
jgi:hypothetical protein